MRAVMLEVPQALLDERRARGADRWDEMWEGELHLVPPPSDRHQDVSLRLARVLAPLAEARGLIARAEGGLCRPESDHEVLSPDDETYTRLSWYADLGVTEVLVVEPDTMRVELFASRDGRMEPVEPVIIEALGVRAETVDGKLRLTWDGGSADT